jgi:serine/threonine protein kinase
MGVELIKDRQGKEHMVLSDEDFYNDDIMGDKFEDYEILQVITDKNKYGFFAKVRSKINSKIYAMKKINSEFVENQYNLIGELNTLKNMKNPNTAKYFKGFYENQSLYIIYEYMNNNDLEGFLNAYESLDKPIETNTLWNIFMQCISSLKYIHNNNIIHRNITLTNIFMSENKIIKLGDFRFAFLSKNEKIKKKENELYKSPETKNNYNFDKKNDIYSMGVVFYKLCHFEFPNDKNSKNQGIYPSEMENIINSMLKKENERPDANQLYNEIMKEYIKNVAKISSIDSVFRCMYSFTNFFNEMSQRKNNYSNEELTPISFNFIKCIEAYNSNNINIKDIALNLNNFRNLLYQNSQINNDMEIKPSLVLDFLLEKLNKETGNNFNGLSFLIQPSNFNRNKDTSLNQFKDYFNNNFNSIVSKYFVGIIKTKRICKVCRAGYYSFNLYPFIEFDLDRCGQELNLSKWFKMQNDNNSELAEDHNVICDKCKCIRKHNEFKQFYSLPQNFIISINRGEGFKNESNIKYEQSLNLYENIDDKNQPYFNFNLIGIVKRMKDANKGEEYYISIYYDKGRWMKSDREKLIEIKSPFNDNDGMVMLLFYSATNN